MQTVRVNKKFVSQNIKISKYFQHKIHQFKKNLVSFKGFFFENLVCNFLFHIKNITVTKCKHMEETCFNEL